MVEIVAQMADEVGPVAALPNPGLPQLVGGHIRFRGDVDHFAGYGFKLATAGARLVGGCCGTTPAHVRALSEALRDFRVEGKVARPRVDVVEQYELLGDLVVVGRGRRKYRRSRSRSSQSV